MPLRNATLKRQTALIFRSSRILNREKCLSKAIYSHSERLSGSVWIYSSWLPKVKNFLTIIMIFTRIIFLMMQRTVTEILLLPHCIIIKSLRISLKSVLKNETRTIWIPITMIFITPTERWKRILKKLKILLQRSWELKTSRWETLSLCLGSCLQYALHFCWSLLFTEW